MARLKLTAPEMATFSSYMGTVKFTNGVSDEEVSSADARLLGSITKVAFIDENDDEIGMAGLGQENVDLRTKGAPIVKDNVREADAPSKAEEVTPPDIDVVPEAPKASEEDKTAEELEEAIKNAETDGSDGENAPVKVYTREDLEAVADEKGIAGLREIGDALGQKSNSVETLIDKILTAQE